MADDDALRDPRTLPHYILATLAGEQLEHLFAEELHTRNRALWNRWATQDLDDAALQALIDAGRVPAADVADRSLAPVEAAAKARDLDPLPSSRAPIDFSNTRWVGPAAFSGFYFPSLADFESATFEDTADFQSATFEGSADFESATFEGDATFQSATFERYASFQSATFKDRAAFRSAAFKGVAAFQSAMFGSHATFLSAAFHSDIIFEGVTFRSDVSLERASVKGQVRLSRAHFLTEPPNLENAELGEQPKVDNVNWPKTPRADRSRAMMHAASYNRLLRAIGPLAQHEAELLLLAKELDAKRQYAPRGEALLIYLYSVISDYGRSVWRPLYTGFLVWFACALSYSILEPSRWDEHKAMGFSAASLAGVLGARRELFAPEVLREAGWPVQLLSTGQSVVGAVLIFLIGLALRNRFRIR